MSAKFDINDQFSVMKCPIFHPKVPKICPLFGQNMSPLKRKKPTLMADGGLYPANGQGPTSSGHKHSFTHFEDILGYQGCKRIILVSLDLHQ